MIHRWIWRLLPWVPAVIALLAWWAWFAIDRPPASVMPSAFAVIATMADLAFGGRLPGDILATGTNHRGLSAFQDGDRVELEVQGMGRLAINVRDDLKRTWARATRLDRAQAGFKDPTPQLTGKYAPAA